MTTEICLLVRERLIAKPEYITWRPVGSVVTTVPYWQTRWEWLQVVCDLARPEKRAEVAGRAYPIPGWSEIVTHWDDMGRPLYDAYFEEHRYGNFRRNPALVESFWATNVDAALPGAVGTEPTGVVNRFEARWWSPRDLADLFVIVNSDEPDEGTFSQWSAVVEETMSDSRLVRKKESRFDWETRLGLTEGTKNKIRNPDFIVDPRFDLQVVASLRDAPSAEDEIRTRI